MEKRDLKIIFSKGGSGSISSRVTLPIKWIKKMGLEISNRELEVTFNEEKNIIEIKPKKEKNRVS
ncbi:AbrB/MazE/SpoVT family DNA-binding domain-containing protein [Cetobacterium sp. 2A]|uniref:AbrB/MazE/SpoVT family DNA-binding domain-containing protein n=1 Tax=Cetobacterium sp. 2A TaxID=2754723 RepID=UPI00163CBEC9|nr:AbrB/MazE/SpoVT family DNA-binding domain-containing protein [Cetobacterium sp. 2A]MBC2856990.1 AbrB/MazE/SpoVT family DNA-binding domain-containing protein [Cetobacterium sp. 2A]